MLVDATAGYSTFSYTDGFNGCNQIKMHSFDIEKNAFRTIMGNFYYIVMSSGLEILVLSIDAP